MENRLIFFFIFTRGNIQNQRLSQYLEHYFRDCSTLIFPGPQKVLSNGEHHHFQFYFCMREYPKLTIKSMSITFR